LVTLAILKRSALTVAPGTTDAAWAHITTVTERLNLVKRQIKDVTYHDADCAGPVRHVDQSFGLKYLAVHRRGHALASHLQQKGGHGLRITEVIV
jgi:hypothetical protein